MEWSTRRQLIIFLGFIGILVLVGFVIIWRVFLLERPTCNDGIQNGEETGIDCGGSCRLICEQEALAPLVAWSKAVPSAQDTYHLLAYVENRNRGAALVDMPYEFTIFDRLGQEMEVLEGQVSIGPDQPTVVFESRVSLPATPGEVFFEFLADPRWQRSDPAGFTRVVTDSIRQDTAALVPTVRGTIQNTTEEVFTDMSAVVIVYDRDNNTIGASRTFVDRLPAGGSQDIVYTWPELFSAPANRYEVVLMREPVLETPV